jgi:hypothetical protein
MFWETMDKPVERSCLLVGEVGGYFAFISLSSLGVKAYTHKFPAISLVTNDPPQSPLKRGKKKILFILPL